jgi:zinc protease
LPRLDIRFLPGPHDVLRRELENGIVVLARENFATPSVVIQGFVSAGSIHVSRQQAGLADLAAIALMRGTEKRTFRQVFETIESLGANLGFNANAHTTSFQGKSLAEDLDTVLDLLAETLRYPSFPAAEVTRLKAEALTELSIRDQDTGCVARIAFDDQAYPGHPYGVQPDGYRETVEALSPKDLRAFHRAFFGPKGMIIAIVGAVAAEAAVEKVGAAFGEWRTRRRPAEAALPPVHRPEGIVRKEVVLEGKSQSDIVVGVPGPSRLEPGYLAAAVGNNILGRFGLMGRIGAALRASAGLAYYAHSALLGGPGPGPWQISAGVNPANVERAVALIRKEIARFTTRRVSPTELAENQAQFIGRLPLQMESNEGVATSLVFAERYRLGLDYYLRFPDLIAAVSRDQIHDMARRYWDPDRLVVSVAGAGTTGG